MFDDVVFVNTRLTGVYLRDCDFRSCDFRYTFLAGTTFQDSAFHDCDFYRAYFEAANVFTKASFERVSLDKAWLVGIIGLTQDSFPPGAMVQECDESAYAEFLKATTGDRPATHSLAEALENAMLDVVDVYRSLSGMWTAQGQLKDAGFAYVQCKTLERRYYSPLRRWKRARGLKRAQSKPPMGGDKTRKKDVDTGKRPRRNERVAITANSVGKWLALLVAWSVANFGESMRRVLVCLGLLIVLPAAGFSQFGGIRMDGTNAEVRSFPRCVLFSLEQLTASVHHMHSSNSFVDAVGSVQVFGGVTLLGLLGFTIANRLRNA